MRLELLDESHLDALLPLVAAYHAFEGIDMSGADRRYAVRRLLADPALGGIFAVTEADRWVGYIALTRGYSIEFQGADAFIDEFFIAGPYRHRGIGSRALEAVKAYAAGSGIRALHLEVDRGNLAARSVYSRLGFQARDRYSLMSVRLDGNRG